jgi:hypothetical protein
VEPCGGVLIVGTRIDGGGFGFGGIQIPQQDWRASCDLFYATAEGGNPRCGEREGTEPYLPALNPILIDYYEGPHFCDDPSVGQFNRFNPFGRINTGKIGGRPEARRDLNAIAVLNGIVPTTDVLVREDMFDIAINFPVPFPLRAGWYVYRNPFNGQQILGNRGLEYRVDPRTHDVRLDIPQGFMLPNGKRLEQRETCHYH